MSQADTASPAGSGERKPKKVPFHEKIKMLIIQSTVGITGDLSSAKAGELLVLFALLEGSKMPVAAAHELAVTFAGWPETLKKAGQTGLAELVQGVLEDLRARQDEPKAPGVDMKELARLLWYLGEHIHLVRTWSRRGDMHPDAVNSIRLMDEAFHKVTKLVPPQES